MATVSPYNQREFGSSLQGIIAQTISYPPRNGAQTWVWQTAGTDVATGAANDDTVEALHLPRYCNEIVLQAFNTFPASTVITVKGGLIADVSKHVALKDKAGNDATISAANGMVALRDYVPYVSFGITGGSAGDIDVFLMAAELEA